MEMTTLLTALEEELLRRGLPVSRQQAVDHELARIRALIAAESEAVRQELDALQELLVAFLLLPGPR
jgi:hypothetical protein